jgi:cell division protein FtsN/nucleoid DNA-binding protein
MNRDDLLKRCVDRRVAHETSVVAVSHLFYVYLLSSLKKGQPVEVPNFGTFGTRMVGAKRQRRMPYFDVESDLADKVNERYRNLKTLLVGRYELIPVEGEVEYEGKEPPYDAMSEKLGREVVLDTYRESTTEQFREQMPIPPPSPKPAKTQPITTEQPLPAVTEPVQRDEPSEEATPQKEKRLMPNLNLRGQGMDETPPPSREEETQPAMPAEPPPTMRDYSYVERGMKWWVQGLILLAFVGGVTFLLNQFGVVHFWGPKSPTTVEESLPPEVQPPSQIETGAESTAEQEPAPTPGPPSGEEKKTIVEETKPPITEPPKKEEIKPLPPTGDYTLQLSSWDKRIDAVRMVSRLSKAGIDAYIAEGLVKGRTWYRVRVGRYATEAEARAASSRVESLSGNGVWVTKVN